MFRNRGFFDAKSKNPTSADFLSAEIILYSRARRWLKIRGFYDAWIVKTTDFVMPGITKSGDLDMISPFMYLSKSMI